MLGDGAGCVEGLAVRPAVLSTHGGSGSCAVSSPPLEQVLPELDEADNPCLWRLWHEMTRLIADTDPHPTD